MKNTEALLKEARNIIIHENLSSSPKNSFNSKAVKKLRRFFMLSCVAELGVPFSNRIAGYTATE
jgi:hypothetical protein